MDSRKEIVESQIAETKKILEQYEAEHKEILLKEAKEELNRKFAGKFFKWKYGEENFDITYFYFVEASGEFVETSMEDTMKGFSFHSDGYSIEISGSDFYIVKGMEEITKEEFSKIIKESSQNLASYLDILIKI